MQKLLLCLFILCLASPAIVGTAAHPLTQAGRLQGSDDRGTFDLRYVQLTSEAVPDPALRSRVNAALEQAARISTCVADPALRHQMSSAYSARVTYASREALAVDARTFLFCGYMGTSGLHSSLYDLRAGEETRFEDEFADYAGFRAAAAALMLEQAPASPSAYCADGYTLEHFSHRTVGFGITEKGLVARPAYSGERRGCLFAARIPFPVVAPFVRPGSTLERVITESAARR